MSLALTIALAQFNPKVGDIAGNAERITRLHGEAKTEGADLLIVPELALIGYPPEDLVLMPSFRKEAMAQVKKLAQLTVNGPAMVLGSVWEENGRAYNAALLLDSGEVAHAQPKINLPNYGVFDEKRIFESGADSRVAQWRGRKLGLLVCEDVWTPQLAEGLKKQGAEILIVINASPYEAGKLAHRHEITAKTVRAVSLPLIYANLVGGQDDIVFDGGSFALAPDGSVAAQLAEFRDSLAFLEWNGGLNGDIEPVLPREETLWQAMMLGLSDYLRKNNFPGVLIGLSGGIDSAITACVAADALGPERVKGVLLPSPYTSKESVSEAEALAGNLGIETITIPITPGMQVFDEVLSPVFKSAAWMEDVSVGGNMQARLRGLTLMSLSNRSGSMLMATGNKSEIAVGYTTLYGDSCGGYNVLKDLYKTQIYALARWRNANHPRGGLGGKGSVIPPHTISRAPTAELAPNQKDEDQLPPYSLLDKILYHHIEEQRGEEEIIALGFDAAVVKKVVRMVRNSEFKRRQSCPGVKLSPMMFGRDRRYPLTNGF